MTKLAEPSSARQVVRSLEEFEYTIQLARYASIMDLRNVIVGFKRIKMTIDFLASCSSQKMLVAAR
ncbi:hypothetical protein D3C87_1955190 [compost metagenome]